MPSTIRGSDNFDTAGGNAVKAWVNFNGTGTVAIRASFNVSSITDNGTGRYTLNFTNAMPDVNYAVLGTARGGDSTDESMEVVGVSFNTEPTTSAVAIAVSYFGTFYDTPMISVAIFR
jgi:hypothetical protein